jgi:hypothetical protein
MARTIVGLFDTFEDAQRAVQALIDQGFASRDISVVAADAEGRLSSQTGESAVAESAGAGAVGGTVVGGVIGLLVGLGALAIPGIGPVIAAGPLAAAIGTAAAAVGTAALGAGIGAASGGLLGALVGAGIPEDEAAYYSEGVRRGGTLVAVSTDDSMADTAQMTLNNYGAINIRERGEAWGDRSTWADSYTTAGSSTSGERAIGQAESNWQESSKVGTAGGTLAGAATGAAIGAAGGPVGAVVGGVAGAATGAGVGAAGDAAGREAQERGYFDDDYYRNDYNSNYASSGYGYEHYQPAYRYGYDLAADPTYRGRTWYDIENDVRGGWDESRYGPWDRFKDAVRRGWERTKDAVSNDFDGGAMRSGTTRDVSSQRHDYGSSQGGMATSNQPTSGPYTASPQDFGGETTGTRGYGYTDESSETRGSTVRSYDANPGAAGSMSGSAFDDNYWQNDYNSNYASSGYGYEHYQPAYRYGYDLAADPTYRGRTWYDIENDVRGGWDESRYGPWDRFKDAVRRGWERTKDAVR